MKRSLTAAILAIMILLAGCQKPEAPMPEFGRDDLRLFIGGVWYSPDMDIETVIAHLGGDYIYAEARSCDYDGLDKSFIYPAAEFYTYPSTSGRDLVNEIYTQDISAQSSRGIGIGASQEEVFAAYSGIQDASPFELVYSVPPSDDLPFGASLCFDLAGGAVTAIYITARSL
ncbi:MAG: hypothetical protein FWH00_01385 [Oscillospiraceae bacterium]|nr:hypothetical protein [Oscillospiraceae bacterium]